MNVADTLWQCFNRYPTLYQSRADVIDQLFFVIGNGYEWKSGELVCGKRLTEQEIVQDRVEHALRSAERWAEYVARVERSEPDFAAIAEERLNEEFALKIGPRRVRQRMDFYPVCEYSRINGVPDDVRPDWLRLAREAARMLITAETRKPYDPEFAHGQENAAWGRRVLADLDKRFGKVKR